MHRDDRIAIENAALVLKSIMDRAHDNPEFARHIHNLPVPGGSPMSHFANAISATATRYPTEWMLAKRRDSQDAA